jgi:hypothetical protein
MVQDTGSSNRESALSTGGVTYQRAGETYFDKRQLTRHAGAVRLWGLGVAAVISGDFSGWNLGIAEAGWGGMLVATVVIALMYLLMIFSIAEMSATMPHTGGAYSFARSAMGPWGGYVTGVAETIEYVFTTAVVGDVQQPLRRRDLSDALRGQPGRSGLWMLIFYVIFVALNTLGCRRVLPVRLHHRDPVSLGAGHLLRHRAVLGSSRPTTSSTSSRRRAVRPSCRSGSAASCSRCPSPSGSSSASRSFRWPRRRRTPPSRTSPRGPSPVMFTLS